MINTFPAHSDVDVVFRSINDLAAVSTDLLPKRRVFPVCLYERPDVYSPALLFDPVDQFGREPHGHLGGSINLTLWVLPGASAPSLGLCLFLF